MTAGALLSATVHPGDSDANLNGCGLAGPAPSPGRDERIARGGRTGACRPPGHACQITPSSPCLQSRHIKSYYKQPGGGLRVTLHRGTATSGLREFPSVSCKFIWRRETDSCVGREAADVAIPAMKVWLGQERFFGERMRGLQGPAGWCNHLYSRTIQHAQEWDHIVQVRWER